MRGYLYSAIVRRTGMDGLANWALGEHFERLGWGIGDLFSAPDDVLLQAKGFGPKSLEKWRTVVPSPQSRRGEHTPWILHAKMIAGCPDV